MKCLTLYLLTAAAYVLALSSPHDDHFPHDRPNACACIQARLPPTFNLPSTSCWRPPPAGWTFGDWALTYSSKPAYHVVWNVQVHQNPLPNPTVPGQLADVTSWGYSPNDTHTYTVYGIDTPHYASGSDDSSPYNACGNDVLVYDFAAAGTLAGTADTFSTLAWGYDSAGIGFEVFYEGQESNGGAAPALDVLSRSEEGPTAETLYAIYSALARLGNANITALIRNVTATPNSGTRVVGPVACDASCMNNTNIVP